MKNLMDMLKEAMGRGKTKIEKLRGEISGTNWAEVNITNFRDEPIDWDSSTNPNVLKFRIQPLHSGLNSFAEQEGRIDNAHGFLHQDTSTALKIPLGDMSVSTAITNFYTLFGKR